MKVPIENPSPKLLEFVKKLEKLKKSVVKDYTKNMESFKLECKKFGF